MEKQHFGSVKMAVKKSGFLWIFFALLIILVLSFEVLPAADILLTSFKSKIGNGLTLDNYKKAFTERYYLISLKNSIVLSVSSAFFGIFIGTCAALCIKGVSEKAARKMITIINMTTNYSGIPLAFAFIVLLGSNGIFTVFMKSWFGWNIYTQGFNLFSWSGITLVYIYFQIPLAVMLMFPAVGGIKDSVKEAAKIFGASNFKFWLTIGIPTLMPALLGSFCILFANALGAYATAYALVNSSKGIVAISIANLVSGDINPNPYLACALATIMGGILMIMVFIKNKLNKRSS